MEALTCLSILSYGRPNTAACLPDEHERILSAIESGEAVSAADLMRHHLEHVESEMDLFEAGESGLAQALAAA
jgi:DNA-binding GntR family transcriptional regulator